MMKSATFVPTDYRVGDLLKLPGLETGLVNEVAVGRLGLKIVKLAFESGSAGYLKDGTGEAATDIIDEAKRLKWLGKFIKVPTVKRIRSSDEGRVLVVLSEVAGSPSHLARLSRPKRVELLAEALREIHAIPITDCPFKNTLAKELAEAQRRCQSPKLDVVEFEKETNGLSPVLALEWLKRNRGMIEEITFTHGDYCLPNVMLNKGKIEGVLDWGIAGVADLHRDLMAMLESIEFNLGKKWTHWFLDAYGMPQPDTDRIHYYWLLDRFFSHYET